LDCSEGPKIGQNTFSELIFSHFHRDLLGYKGGTQLIGICLYVSKGTPGAPKKVHVHILPVSALTGWDTTLVYLSCLTGG